MDSLVTTQWLAEHLSDPDLVVIDCSVEMQPGPDGRFGSSSGRPAYESSHIPGAGFADLTTTLSNTDAAIEFAVPTPDAFCAAMGELGVGDTSRVVLYDTTFSAWAARVWWMLRWVGFDDAALLDGGFRTWTAESRPVTADPTIATPRTLTPAVRPQLIADRDEVRAAVDDPDVHLIDTLMEEHFRGDFTMYDRPGHIPGATNASALELLDDTGRYRPLDELAAVHAADDDTDHDARTITYCGGGIAASSNAFVLARLGFTNLAVYTASLQEWAADPANPLVIADE